MAPFLKPDIQHRPHFVTVFRKVWFYRAKLCRWDVTKRFAEDGAVLPFKNVIKYNILCTSNERQMLDGQGARDRRQIDDRQIDTNYRHCWLHSGDSNLSCRGNQVVSTQWRRWNICRQTCNNTTITNGGRHVKTSVRRNKWCRMYDSVKWQTCAMWRCTPVRLISRNDCWTVNECKISISKAKNMGNIWPSQMHKSHIFYTKPKLSGHVVRLLNNTDKELIKYMANLHFRYVYFRISWRGRIKVPKMLYIQY